jgi:hypothetical protein
MRRPVVPALLLVAIAAVPATRAQAPAVEALHRAFVGALRPALPFPEADANGMPRTGGASPVWTVRWPEAGEGPVEVLANPLNAENRERALAAEKAIQQAAMRSQRRSQGDYEQALRDFERTGRVSDIREISLDDAGVAGERYDADSHLILTVAPLDDALAFSIATAIPPEVVTDVAGPSTVVRVAANVYRAPGEAGAPPEDHYCAEQAWVVFGASGPAAIVRRDGVAQVDVTVPVAPARGGGSRGAVVSISGNPTLVEQALKDADWQVLRALFGG